MGGGVGGCRWMSEREAGSDSDSDSDSVTDTVSDSVTDTVSVTVSGCWKGGVPGVGECAGLKQLAL
jgi:hypothetical protein